MKKPFEDSKPRKVKPVEVSLRADVTFISAGIIAAQNSDTTTRDNVIADISNVMSCASEDLDFLFKSSDDDPSIYDFPDSERRRKVIAYNKLDAAE